MSTLADVPSHSIIHQKELAPKKASVLFVLFMTVFTIGIYVPYWFLSRRRALNTFDGQHMLPVALPVVVLLLYSGSTFLWALGWWVHFDINTYVVYQAFNPWITWLGFITAIYLAVKSRAMLAKGTAQKKPNLLLTIVFLHVYLQYWINKRFHKEGDTDAKNKK